MVEGGIWEHCENHVEDCEGKDCMGCISYKYNDNTIYSIYSRDNNNITSVLHHSNESTEIEMDIKDGMEEDEVRRVVEAVLKAEYAKGMSYNQQEALEHKIKRFLVKATRGAECGYKRKLRFRWFTCTESDEAIDEGIDVRRLFNKFFTMVRYHCPDFQYIVIEHRQGDCWRRNWHVLTYGTDKLPLDLMDAWWKANFKGMITGMEEIRSMKKAVKYVAGYLAEPEKYVRSFHSQGWVFPGWLVFSRKCHQVYGLWLNQDRLVEMALMPDDERKLAMEFILNEEVISFGKEYSRVYGAMPDIGILMQLSKLKRGTQEFEVEYLMNTGNMSSEYK